MISPYVLLLISILAFGGAQFFFKMASSQTKTSPPLILLMAAAFALLVPVVWLIYLKIQSAHIVFDKRGVLFSLLGGLGIGIYTTLILLVYRHIDIHIAAPTLFIGASTIASVLGVIFLKESLSVVSIAGLILIIAGIYLMLGFK